MGVRAWIEFSCRKSGEGDRGCVRCVAGTGDLELALFVLVFVYLTAGQDTKQSKIGHSHGDFLPGASLKNNHNSDD